MSQPFIIGLEDSVADSALRTTKDVYNLVGHNTGNLAFHRAIKKILGGALQTVPWTAENGPIKSAGSIGVVPCANQVGSHADYGRTAANFAQFDCKLVAIGLGAQGNANLNDIPEVPEGTIRWIKEIGARANGSEPNISVRGPFTKKVLDHYEVGQHAVVLGCPTLFINPEPQLGEQIARRAAKSNFDRVCVSAGHYAWKHLTRIENSLTRIMAATGGSYVVQSPIEMVAMARGDWDEISDETFAQLKVYATPELDNEQFKAWAFKHARAFLDISAWMEYLRTYDLVVGARIHGVMLALQAGVPGLCIAHDSRTRELCETMKVPFVLSSEVSAGISRDDLRRHFNFDAAEFDENRQQLGKRFSTFLQSNDLKASDAYADLLRH